MRNDRLLSFGFSTLATWICLSQFGASEPAESAKGMDSLSCSTSGCHGGAGLNRGAYHIFKRFDPHSNAAATLTNGRSRAIARQMGIENAAESKSCTICHSPMESVGSVSKLPAPPEGRHVESGVSCASCHGPAEKWLLSHTRPDYPKDALAQLGMRQLSSAYQRANNCVACHQNLNDELVKVKHPPLIFELDGLLIAEPKHWNEDKGFSNTKTWLVGQAVALREAAAQAKREPGDRRTAEIEAIRALLKATGTGWSAAGNDLVRSADDYAKRISSAPMSREQSIAIYSKLLSNRAVFQADEFSAVVPAYRMWAVGYYAERLALAMDRLNEALTVTGKQARISKDTLKDLFDAARPPEAFDAVAVEEFVSLLDRISKSHPESELNR